MKANEAIIQNLFIIFYFIILKQSLLIGDCALTAATPVPGRERENISLAKF